LLCAVPEIRGNTARWGGGLYINHAESSFILEDGILSGNTAQFGGGIYCRTAGTFFQNGGTIQGNSPDDIFEFQPQE